MNKHDPYKLFQFLDVERYSVTSVYEKFSLFQFLEVERYSVTFIYEKFSLWWEKAQVLDEEWKSTLILDHNNNAFLSKILQDNLFDTVISMYSLTHVHHNVHQTIFLYIFHVDFLHYYVQLCTVVCTLIMFYINTVYS